MKRPISQFWLWRRDAARGREAAYQNNIGAVAGKPLLTHTFSALLQGAPGARLLAAIHPDDAALYKAALGDLPERSRARLLPPALGGETRQISVKNGLEALARHGAPQIVLIHDGARPFPNQALIGGRKQPRARMAPPCRGLR